jgi:sterol desaturase/sphingolipid hydroxylase (fatty acid hydroxylase superfamily)
MGIFEHMNVKLWPPRDTALSLVLGTPNMHKLHHSRLFTETNTNYGNSGACSSRLT